MTNSNKYVLREHAHSSFLASRTTALQMRKQIEELLLTEPTVVIDFAGVGVTQSFTDELVGVLAYKRGTEGLKRIVFKGCTVEHKKILNFVVAHRISTRVDLPQPEASRHHIEHPELASHCL